MDVKQAVAAAKAYLADLLADERVSGITLEEVWFDEGHGQWCVTLGVHRPLNALMGPISKTDYKSIRVSDKDGRVISVKNRTSEAA